MHVTFILSLGKRTLIRSDFKEKQAKVRTKEKNPSSRDSIAPRTAPGGSRHPRRAATASALSAGVYRREEAHLLLKAFQIRGSVDVFVSKFENDNWGLDGYVSTACEAGHALGLRGRPVCAEGGGASELGTRGRPPSSTAPPLAARPRPQQQGPASGSTAPPPAARPRPQRHSPAPSSTAPPHRMAAKPGPRWLSLQGTRRGLRHMLCAC